MFRSWTEGDACDVLYWIGCLTTFDEDKQGIAENLLQILGACGVDFRVLGRAETCCGDPARVCGAENLFQTVAKNQVEELNKREFKTLLVSCPHCYNVLKNEYPQFGGRFHSFTTASSWLDLVQTGRLSRGRGITVQRSIMIRATWVGTRGSTMHRGS